MNGTPTGSALDAPAEVGVSESHNMVISPFRVYAT